jgi:hypothetical protein
MAALSKVAIRRHFVTLKDPRVRRRTQHRLMDIIVIVICGVIADCDSWREIELLLSSGRRGLSDFSVSVTAFRRMTRWSACSTASTPGPFPCAS